jgi:hypothetical protein
MDIDGKINSIISGYKHHLTVSWITVPYFPSEKGNLKEDRNGEDIPSTVLFHGNYNTKICYGPNDSLCSNLTTSPVVSSNINATRSQISKTPVKLGDADVYQIAVEYDDGM